MQWIDKKTQDIATKMLNVPSDDWREIAAAGGVDPSTIEEVLSWDLPEEPTDESLRKGLEEYRREIHSLLKKELADVLNSEYDSDREFAKNTLGLLSQKFWTSAVQPSEALRAAIRKAVKTAMGKMPVPA